MINNDEPMDPASAEYLNLLLEGAGEFDAPTPILGELLSFLMGTCGPEEEAMCLEALVQSAAQRQDLIHLQARFADESLLTLSQDPTFGGSLLASLRAAFDSLSGKFERDRAVPSFVWRSVGNGWRQMLSSPRYATVRGAEDTIGIRGTEQRLRVSADVVGGDLQVVLYPGSQEISEQLSFAIKDPGGTLLPLWQGPLGSEPVPLSFSKLADQLGFGEGPVPSNLFAISVVTTLPDQEGSIDLRLSNGHTVRLPLAEPISIQFGRLRLAVDVSSLDRAKAFDVQFLVQMGSIDLILGKATIRESESVLRFETEILQIESLEIWGTSLVKIVAV